MICKKKGMVFLFAILMLASMMMMPHAVNPKTEATGLAPAPESSDMGVINSIIDRINDGPPSTEKVDSLLASYMGTGEVDSTVVQSRNGDVSVLLYLNPSVPSSVIMEYATIDWVMNIRLMKVALVKVSSRGNMKMLSEIEGLNYMSADKYIDRELTRYDNEFDDISTNMFEIRDIVGATGAAASAYDGTGVKIGIVDHGVDFSHPDMVDAMAVDGDGLPESYDPSGYTITTMVQANRTVLTGNVTAYLEAGNLLTYESGGKYYLNTTGWDPVVTDTGYTWDYMFGYFFGAYMQPEVDRGFNNWTEFTTEVLWRDWEIPAPTADNYTAGWAFQRRIDDALGYQRMFAPALVMNKADLIIDFNTSKGFSMVHNMVRYGEPGPLNLSVQADRDFITDMCDWSFVDDVAAGYTFNVDADINAGNIIAADTDDDGEVDWGLGGMCWAWDNLGLFPGLL